MDALTYPYPSRRSVVYAERGMVATSQPLAAQAGLEVLRRGGNAIDAAVAAAACLTVVEPTSNGIGADAFAIIYHQGKLYGLNASGPAPLSLTAEHMRSAGHVTMPRFGLAPVTVPGAPAAWAALMERFGRLGLEAALAPAIEYARDGYPLSPVLGKYWAAAQRAYARALQGPVHESFLATFMPGGRAPRIGEKWRSPGHAATLEAIARTGARDFYEGELAQRIAAFCKQHGGYLSEEDLASFAPEWVEPLGVSYRGYDVWELPPNGQGVVALQTLQILKQLGPDLGAGERFTHLQIEALKLAFADGLQVITDPKTMAVSASALLDETYARQRAALIGEEAGVPFPGSPPKGGTVYLATADRDGSMVSFIQSNYMGFGAGVVIPDTGISLQNRGHTFSLDATHANYLEPGKRTYHTIISGFLTKDGEAVGPFGVMGGYMQPQGHVQVVMNMLDLGMNPQAALDAPRWQWHEGRKVEVERGIPEHVAQALARRGHEVTVALDSGGFGRGQIILRDAQGILAGGTEPRTDGQIAAW
ncbi:MAG: gamma-glutamyltransferase family protein [Firmicutes bacterium]|nr:gamma-glutamyltransferase family protein [Bacillota bacterium]